MIEINKQDLATGFLYGFHDIDKFHELPIIFKQQESEKYFKEELINKTCKVIEKLKPPIVVLYSGGVDSTFVLNMVKRCFESKDIIKITIKKQTEKDVDKCLNVITEDTYKNWFYSSSLIPTYKAYRIARMYSDTVLTGDGGDELFCGYDRYLFVRYNKYFKFLNTFDYKSAKYQKVKRFYEYGYSGMLMQWDVQDVMRLTKYSPIIYLSCLINNYQNLMNFDIKTELVGTETRKINTAARMAGIKVVSPLLEKEIFTFCHQIPLKYKIRGLKRKYLLKKINNKSEFKKKGFSSPIQEFVKLPKYKSIILKNNNSIVKRLYQEHLEGKKDHGEKLWSIMVYNTLRDRNIMKVID